MESLYEMMFKRKSVRRFDPALRITQEELAQVSDELCRLRPLKDEIGVTFRIVLRGETSCKWGEYCLLAYSEEKDGFLLNIGYLLEQWDLYLASLDIGVCWYGIGKPREQWAGNRKFIIMLAFGKSKPEDFRSPSAKVKRKQPQQIWQGVDERELAAVVRYAPSACNSQPWRVSGFPGRLEVFRSAQAPAILARGLVSFLNKIDMGIFLCFLELALNRAGQEFQRVVLPEHDAGGSLPVAVYTFPTADSEAPVAPLTKMEED